jgi:hypothetical protein
MCLSGRITRPQEKMQVAILLGGGGTDGLNISQQAIEIEGLTVTVEHLHFVVRNKIFTVLFGTI